MTLLKKFEDLGGFEAVKKAFEASDIYDFTVKNCDKRDKESWCAIGAQALISELDGKLSFNTFGGICHASSRSLNTTHVVIFSFPVVMNSKKETVYTKEFLDSFYTWLTTESHVKHVFYEPWNGQYLSVNPFQPTSHCLLALIASRTPSERYCNRKVWMEAIKSGMSWFDSMIMLPEFHTYEARLKGNSGGTCAHAPYPFSYLNEKELKFLLSEELLTRKEDLPWNSESSMFGGVWKSVGLKSYNTNQFFQKHSKDLNLALGYKYEEYSWGGQDIVTTKDTPPLKKQIPILIDHFSNLFKSIRENK
jgi:hypothetical protein